MWIVVCTFISAQGYALIAPFLPLEFTLKGVDPAVVGFIFAIYSSGFIINSVVAGMVVSRFGTTNLIACGTIVMGTSFFLFGFIEYMENTKQILVYSMVLRFIQGAASSLI